MKSERDACMLTYNKLIETKAQVPVYVDLVFQSLNEKVWINRFEVTNTAGSVKAGFLAFEGGRHDKASIHLQYYDFVRITNETHRKFMLLIRPTNEFGGTSTQFGTWINFRYADQKINWDCEEAC